MPDEEFDVLGEDKLALLTRRFDRLHENRVNMMKDRYGEPERGGVNGSR
jgi:hypothetical protein